MNAWNWCKFATLQMSHHFLPQKARPFNLRNPSPEHPLRNRPLPVARRDFADFAVVKVQKQFEKRQAKRGNR